MSGPQDPLPRAIRGAAGEQNLTRSDIARFVGLSHTTVGEWFSGDRTPSRDQLIELEVILHVEPGQLCVLAGYLPPGNDPKVEKTENGLLVRLSLGLILVPIIYDTPGTPVWVPRPIPIHVKEPVPLAA